MKYKDQYCKKYTLTNLTSKSYIYIHLLFDRTITMVDTIQANEGYADGPPQIKLKLVNPDIGIRQDQGSINLFIIALV
jgi:hypothetical protein